MPLTKLRQAVFRANSMLVENDLVVLTWGNASGIDRERGLVVIKPSGVSYQDMRPEDLVVVDLDGNIVEGNLRPSSDTPTHLELYRSWPDIGGVVHSHSRYATAFSQATQPVPCYGTTHADYCPGDIPCIPALTREEVEDDYEGATGRSIVRYYAEHGLKPHEYPGAVLSHHGPFTWGKNPVDAADNGLILESVAEMAIWTRLINPGIQPIPGFIIDKHYSRKHGPDAYYGQKK
ncbi:MAG: L-ribulose-5-phosphate 4-epimerase AraD [Planctomycetes bacterium]|nr:L-ribulose-5-phosphate 4-epimerase AraD [Planctomycetota bacterium]